MQPRSVREFVRRPTRLEWSRAIAAGWPGPNGSSFSTDLIMGVRIGLASPEFRYVDLPANRHDWLYMVGRVHHLDWRYRRAADRVYRALCILRLREHLEGPSLTIGILRCHARYAGLRFGAWFAWTRQNARRKAEWTGRGC